MQPRFRRSRLVVIALMACGAVFLAAPAIGQTILGTFTTNAAGAFAGTVTIPAGTPPGIYDLVATGVCPIATPYPPSTRSLSVSSTVVVAGQSISVAGGGLAPGSNVTVSLHFVASAGESGLNIAQATLTTCSLFARIRVVAPGTGVDDDDDKAAGGNIVINNDNRVSCVSNATATASSGRYQIAQAQTGTGGPQININNNNSAKCESTATAVKNIQSTPVTHPVTKVLARTGVDALPLLAAAIATILLGSVLLSAGRRRDRFEGSLRSA